MFALVFTLVYIILQSVGQKAETLSYLLSHTTLEPWLLGSAHYWIIWNMIGEGWKLRGVIHTLLSGEQ